MSSRKILSTTTEELRSKRCFSCIFIPSLTHSLFFVYSMLINFSDHESYHTVPLSTFSTTTAGQLLSEDRKKFLRSVAKVKTGQSAGPGVLSTASKNVYSKLVKQAVSWGFWDGASVPPRTSRAPYEGEGLLPTAFQHRVSAATFSIVCQQRLSASCVSSAFQHCVSAAPFSIVCFKHRVSAMPFSIVCFKHRVSAVPFSIVCFKHHVSAVPFSIVCQQCLTTSCTSSALCFHCCCNCCPGHQDEVKGGQGVACRQ